MIKDNIQQNISLKKFNSWKVGGVAECYVEISTEESLITLLKNEIQLPITILGLGSNTLIRDGGVKGTVINLSKGLKAIDHDHEYIYCESGVSCSTLARFSAKDNKKNCAFLAGIPGSVGGALAMNAGCYGNEIWDFVQKVKIIKFNGLVEIRTKEEFDIGYRSVNKGNDEIFIAAWFNFPLKQDNDEDESNNIKNLLNKRKTSQPINWPTAGSTFRNPENHYAARLIEEVGLKGFIIGGARISEKHANFIENMGNATAQDIEDLIKLAQNKVRDIKKIELHTEIKIIGDKIG